MALTIDKIAGIGGNPPTHIRVEGTVTGCEIVHVLISCAKNEALAPIPTGGANHWSIDIPNDAGCGCGIPVNVKAFCGSGQPGDASATTTLTLNCDPPPCCDEVTLTIDTQPLPCLPVGGGTVSIQFSAMLSPMGCTGPFEWKVTNLSTGVIIQPFTPGGSTFSYPFTSTGPYKINVRVQQASTCEDTSLTDSDTFTIPSCCCPSVTISQPTVTGCAPASAVASFAAGLTWPAGCTPVTPTSFDWTLDELGGKKYQKSTNLPNTDTTTGWNDLNGNPVVVQFTAGGSYSVGVSANIPGAPSSCKPYGSAQVPVSDCCPKLIGPLNASEKPGDPCTWLFSAQVSNPNNAAPITFEWSFQDGTTAITSLPQIEHPYTLGSPASGITTLTLKSPGCSDTLGVPVMLICPMCPMIGTPSAVVTGCIPGLGTAPGTPPSVTLSTSVTPPVATSFDWTVTTPGLTVFTKTTTAASTTDGTADGAWTDTSTGSTGVLNLGAFGGYAVTVKAKGPSISPTCSQPPAMSFPVSICPCPPGMARDASGVCVPITTTTPPPSCSIWCILAGIFFIAIPISAYISTLAHCLLGPPWSIAFHGAVITAAIGIFIWLCGVCCLWRFLLIGAALGVVATIIAAIWLGFPGCLVDGLIALIGFVVLGLGIGKDCGWR